MPLLLMLACLILTACEARVEVAGAGDAGSPSGLDAGDPGDTGLGMPDGGFGDAGCGGPFLPPCSTSCAGGGCLEAGRCVPAGAQGSRSGEVCQAGSFLPCGAPGQPCCPQSTCAQPACCSGSVCVASGAACTGGQGQCATGGLVVASCTGAESCGGLGQGCCGTDEAGFCVAGRLGCHGENCLACGAPGEPCCEAGWCEAGGCCSKDDHCLAQGELCSADEGLCEAGACRGAASPACGGFALPVCAETRCTQPFTAPVNGRCEPCGGEGQPCCPSDHGGWCGGAYACQESRCAACGGSGQPCCLGELCRAGSCTEQKCP